MHYTDDMETIGYLKLLVNGTIVSLPFKFWHFFSKNTWNGSETKGIASVLTCCEVAWKCDIYK